MKAILILMALLGMLMFALIVATATPNDREEYEKYMKWKERKRKDEPQRDCDKCKWYDTGLCWSKIDSDDHSCHYKPKDEPQTEVSTQEYERWVFKEPQTERSE